MTLYTLASVSLKVVQKEVSGVAVSPRVFLKIWMPYMAWVTVLGYSSSAILMPSSWYMNENMNKKQSMKRQKGAMSITT